MIVRICHHLSQGLTNDALVLRDAIRKYNISVVVHIESYPENEIHRIKSNVINQCVDVQIFLKHVDMELIPRARNNIIVPNPEWMNKCDFEICGSDKIDAIVAKTKYGFRSLLQHFPNKTHYWGWTSIDRQNETIWKTFDEYLHVKGCSPFKNTQLLMDTWLEHPEWPPLHIVSYGDPDRNGYIEVKRPYIQVSDNVKLYQRKLIDDELNNLMNRVGIHICPSSTEGFGHYINEARSCGSVVVTTDGTPMNEFVTKENGVLINPISENKQLLGVKYITSQVDIEVAVQQSLDLRYDQMKSKSISARSAYDFDKLSFFSNVAHFFSIYHHLKVII
jgi:glycosyltransferase involved in cell wall biosynthesis